MLVFSYLSEDKRIGYNNAKEVKNHPFFKGVDWEKIRTMKPPFVPEISTEYDTKYFDKFSSEEPLFSNTIQVPKIKPVFYQ